MNRPECGDDEDVVRAITTAHWDPEEGRISSSLFKGERISVSRLQVLQLAVLLDIFDRELVKPPERHVRGAGEIRVGRLKQIGRDFQHAVELSVEQDPTPANPAHAEIPQRISKGLSKRIVDALILHSNETN
jgi:hypothetical protein